jgi:Domain of unknown function (DUF4124)
MRTALLLLLAFAAAAASANTQTVWKWVDEKGVTHYSDRPVPGATKLELNVGTQTGSSAQNARPADPGTPSDTTSVTPGPAYRNFEVLKPANDETIVNTGGAVTINFLVDPALQSGHTLRLLLDGKLVDGPPNATSYEMANVPRGQHVAIGQIFDEAGRRIQETQRVTFYVRQESIAQPPVGPALRPAPPKPQPRGAANKLPGSQPSYSALSGARPVIDPRTNKPVVPVAKPSGPKSGN